MQSISQSRYGGCQKKLRLTGYLLSLTCLGIVADCCTLAKLRCSYPTELVISDNSEVMMDLPRIVLVLGSISTELRCWRPLSLFHSDSSVAMPALTMPELIIV
ncbi:hypothetical protein Acr_17g0013860 [Actinidia rufa]|uniref:Uncharacterized protein n=1 Tax=Actinidia rufa TaxID=165716 RepID=A0A7J0G4V3_9ERIC|nr:hypothetical protein Acr_17g0013860 [Actinidia rufa]